MKVFILILFLVPHLALASPVWDHPTNTRLREAMRRFSIGRKEVSPPSTRNPTTSRAESGFASIFPQITATTFYDRRIASGRGRPKTQLGVALPSPEMLGKNVLIYSPETGRSVTVPVIDVGPWSIDDPWIQTRQRPKAERGISSLRKWGYRARNTAGIDFYPSVWTALGISKKVGKAKVTVIFLEDNPVRTRIVEGTDGSLPESKHNLLWAGYHQEVIHHQSCKFRTEVSLPRMKLNLGESLS
jgi:hypothetical protein